MLVAYNENKQAIILFQVLQHQELHKIKAESFFCPQCAEPVIVKAGTIKIPHFAHKRKTVCDTLFSERESVTHLNGKQQLFQWLQSKNVPVKLEATIPQLQQRPDLLATIQGKRYALEFQCSPISGEVFFARTAGYTLHHIQPIWILNNTFPFNGSAKVQKFKLTHFQRLFVRRGKCPYLVCYDVKSQQFIYYHHLLFVRKTFCVATVSRIPLMSQRLPLLQPSTISKENFRQLFGLFRDTQQASIVASYMFGQAKVQDLLWRSMYELRILYDQLPLTVGIPIPDSDVVAESTLKWQVSLHYYCKMFCIPFSEMGRTIVQRFLCWANFDTTMEAENVVLLYLDICKKVGIETVHSSVSYNQLIDMIYQLFVCIPEKELRK